MTDAALKNAKAQREQLVTEIQKTEDTLRLLRDRLNMADQFIDQWHAFASGIVVLPAVAMTPNENKTENSEPGKRRFARNSSKEEVAAASREIILTHGAPMGRSELYKALIDGGLTIQGADPEGVMNTMLWRTSDLPEGVVHIRSHGYWPRTVASPDHGYFLPPSAEVSEEYAALKRVIDGAFDEADTVKERARLAEIESQHPGIGML